MLIALIIIVVLLALSMAACGVAWLGRRSERWLTQHLARRVIVHTTEGQSLEGLLTTNASDGLVMTAAIFLDSSTDPVQLAGTIWVPREKLAFLQIEPKEKN